MDEILVFVAAMVGCRGGGLFFFFFSLIRVLVVWLWLWQWVAMVGLGLWFGFGQKFQFVGVMGGNGGYRLGGGWWRLLVCLVCGFVHGCSPFKERERERWKKREKK